MTRQQVAMSGAVLAAGHGVHIHGAGTVIVVLVLALVIAGIGYAWRARFRDRKPPTDDWQRDDREGRRPWQ